jgi:hypothetical protein
MEDDVAEFDFFKSVTHWCVRFPLTDIRQDPDWKDHHLGR